VLLSKVHPRVGRPPSPPAERSGEVRSRQRRWRLLFLLAWEAPRTVCRDYWSSSGTRLCTTCTGTEVPGFLCRRFAAEEGAVHFAALGVRHRLASPVQGRAKLRQAFSRRLVPAGLLFAAAAALSNPLNRARPFFGKLFRNLRPHNLRHPFSRARKIPRSKPRNIEFDVQSWPMETGSIAKESTRAI